MSKCYLLQHGLMMDTHGLSNEAYEVHNLSVISF